MSGLKVYQIITAKEVRQITPLEARNVQRQIISGMACVDSSETVELINRIANRVSPESGRMESTLHQALTDAKHPDFFKPIVDRFIQSKLKYIQMYYHAKHPTMQLHFTRLDDDNEHDFRALASVMSRAKFKPISDYIQSLHSSFAQVTLEPICLVIHFKYEDVPVSTNE